MEIAMTIFSLIGTFLISFSMLPQTIVTMRTKETANLSFGLYLLMGFATFLIFFYGIGLVMVPPNIKEQAQAYMDLPNPRYTLTKEYIENLPTSNSVILGYIVPGSAIIFGELFCSVTSFMIAYIKIKNKRAAIKLGITEDEYIMRTYRTVSKGVSNE